MKITFRSKLGNKKIIKQGKVLKEDVVDNIRHFLVRWNNGEEQVTAALPSLKYEYIFEK